MSYRRRDKAIASKILSGCLSGYAPGDQRPAVPAVTQSITEREREVLTRIALGNSNKLTGSAPPEHQQRVHEQSSADTASIAGEPASFGFCRLIPPAGALAPAAPRA